jgi:hypothetical protein
MCGVKVLILPPVFPATGYPRDPLSDKKHRVSMSSGSHSSGIPVSHALAGIAVPDRSHNPGTGIVLISLSSFLPSTKPYCSTNQSGSSDHHRFCQVKGYIKPV